MPHPPRRPWLATLALLAGACSGEVGVPRGTVAGAGSEQNVPPAADTPEGEPAAALGTQVFALCESATEQPGPRLLRLLTRRELRHTVSDLLYVEPPDVASLPLESRVRGFDNNARSQAVTSRHVDALAELFASLAEQALQHKDRLVPCDSQDAACSGRFVESFGLRAFRRPLSAEEQARYLAFFDDSLTQGSFDEGIKLVIQAMLLSPHFLYRSEVGEPQADGTHVLTPYEVASALSYLYWGTMPDAALFERAKAGELTSPEQLRAQAERMLDDPRARDQLGEFSRQWLRSEGVLNTNKDAALFPKFTDSLREAMMHEQERLFTRVVLDQEGSFGDLFTPGVVEVNRELASFYGLDYAGEEFGQTDPLATGRGGILGLGAVLASHAHAMESSPIRRGLFVRDRLLCQDLPPPPQNLDTTPPGLDPTLTTRERFRRHTDDDACRSCHQYIDGVGFGLEEFDAAGEQRADENGLRVDTSGELVGLEGLGDPTKTPFNGASELAELIRDSESAPACLALQYYRFARGHEERRSDACSLERLRGAFQDSQLTVKELLITLATLKSFVVRAGD